MKRILLFLRLITPEKQSTNPVVRSTIRPRDYKVYDRPKHGTQSLQVIEFEL